MEEVLRTLIGLPPILIYLVIGGGAAVENVIPPIPADTFVLFGAFLAAAGRADPWIVFLCTWFPNIASALAVYALAGRYGHSFFRTPVGHWLLHPHQLEQIGRFYERWGVLAIFFSRFLPAFRAMVPVFAGVAHIPVWRIALPLVTASGLWYGGLVYVGAQAGRHWQDIAASFEQASDVLLWVALVLLLALLFWWRVTRRAAKKHG
ncbi:MAG: DedA family protein [Gemmatimonadetes bacterium]|nr:DedA family protein [Gemmatimonadota bacterium]